MSRRIPEILEVVLYVCPTRSTHPTPNFDALTLEQIKFDSTCSPRTIYDSKKLCHLYIFSKQNTLRVAIFDHFVVS